MHTLEDRLAVTDVLYRYASTIDRLLLECHASLSSARFLDTTARFTIDYCPRSHLPPCCE